MSEAESSEKGGDTDGMDELHIEHDAERMTFEAIIDPRRRAVLEYRSNREGKMFLNSTEVPESLRGQGIAGKLVDHVFDYARENNYRIIPVCPYIKHYLKKHPEQQDLMASGIRLS